tara:strand:+ start:419 stop:589 length:171 start_codon:yes stop_codon:yes gene_type:complete
MPTFTTLTPEAQIALLVAENARLKNTIENLREALHKSSLALGEFVGTAEDSGSSDE